MTMDPRTYEKYSGRSGDPYSRLGAALAQSEAQKSRLKEVRSRSITERHLRATLKVRIVWTVIVFALVGAAALIKNLVSG